LKFCTNLKLFKPENLFKLKYVQNLNCSEFSIFQNFKKEKKTKKNRERKEKRNRKTEKIQKTGSKTPQKTKENENR
jgi:hypothetical protein